MLVEGLLAGEKGAFDCPILLKLFCNSDPSARLEIEARMKIDKLPLVKKPREPKVNVPKEPQDQRKKMGFQGSQLTGSSQPEEFAGPSLEALVHNSERFRPRDVEELIEQWGSPEDKLAKMPMADQPKDLQAQLLPYQRQVNLYDLSHRLRVTNVFLGTGVDASHGESSAAAFRIERCGAIMETTGSHRLVHQHCHQLFHVN